MCDFQLRFLSNITRKYLHLSHRSYIVLLTLTLKLSDSILLLEINMKLDFKIFKISLLVNHVPRKFQSGLLAQVILHLDFERITMCHLRGVLF